MKFVLLLLTILSLPILAMQQSYQRDGYTFFTLPAEFLNQEDSQEKTNENQNLNPAEIERLEKLADQLHAQQEQLPPKKRLFSRAMEQETANQALPINQIENEDEFKSPSIEQAVSMEIENVNEISNEPEVQVAELAKPNVNSLHCPAENCVYIGNTKNALRSHIRRGKHKTAEQVTQKAKEAEQRKAQAAIKKFAKRMKKNETELEMNTVDDMVFGAIAASAQMAVDLNSPGATSDKKEIKETKNDLNEKSAQKIEDEESATSSSQALIRCYFANCAEYFEGADDLIKHTKNIHDQIVCKKCLELDLEDKLYGLPFYTKEIYEKHVKKGHGKTFLNEQQQKKQELNK